MIVRQVQDKDLRALWTINQEIAANFWSETQLAAEIRVAGGIGLLIEAEEKIHCGPRFQEISSAPTCRFPDQSPPITQGAKKIYGYAFFRTYPPEAELLQLAVASCYRRQGAGSMLLYEGLERLAKQGCTECFLEVRNSNRAAQYLYKQCGFQQVGIRKKYYHNPVEDALLFCSCLNTMEE